MPEILVIVDFLSHKSQLNVLSLLKRNNLSICSLSYSNILFECVTNLPIIRLESSKVVGGTEFGSVIVFLEPHVSLKSYDFMRYFFMSVTHATTNLAIVATDIISTNVELTEREIVDHMSQLYNFSCFSTVFSQNVL